MQRIIVQIYEVQTPQEAEALIGLGVDHIGSVVVSEKDWKLPQLKDTIETIRSSGAKNSLIALYNQPESVLRTLDYYQPDIVHFCEALSDRAARTPAASALGEMGAAARPAVPDLLRGADDPDPMFRAVAVWAAVRIDPADTRVRAVLERFGAGSDWLMRKVSEAGLARGRR